jgi:hypothetical protein
LKREKTEKKRKKGKKPAWASVPPFGPSEETTRAAHEATHRTPALPNRLTGGPGLAAFARWLFPRPGVSAARAPYVSGSGNRSRACGLRPPPLSTIAPSMAATFRDLLRGQLSAHKSLARRSPKNRSFSCYSLSREHLPEIQIATAADLGCLP